MLMDVGSPAELIRFEQTCFGQGRRQSYLTIQNEAEDTIVALSGHLILLDGAGKPVEERRVSLEDLSAPAGEAFTYHLALDGFPPFEDAKLRVETVDFLREAPWTMNAGRLMDLTPPELPAGRDRVALVAVAGRDAVCFPEKRRSLWVCVCGRFNRWRWATCRRCGRSRDEVFETLVPEEVRAAYRAHVEAVRTQDDRKGRQAAQDQQARQRKKADQATFAARRKKRMRALRRAAAIAGGMLAAAVLLFWLLGGLQNAAAPGRGQVSEAMHTPQVDYLQPLGEEEAGNG